jgi:hypothetical protein
MESVILGTEVKFSIEVVAEGFNMGTDNFSVKIMKGHNVVKEFAKGDLVVSGGSYLLCLDTAEIGAGNFDAAITAEVPDGHFQDGFRTEIVRQQLLTVRKL